MPEPSHNDHPPSGFKLRHTLRGHERPITRVAWSPVKRMIASASLDKTIMVWDAETGALCRTFKGHTGKIYDIAWAPNGQMLASASEDQTLRLWDTKTGELRRTITGPICSVHTVAWSPDGYRLASGGEERLIRIWDAQNGELVQLLSGHSEWVKHLAWWENGLTLASASYDTSIRLWDVETGEALQSFRKHTDWVLNLAWSSDWLKLVTASKDNTVMLWDVETGREVCVLEGHTDSVICASFSSDSRLLATKSLDNSIRIWRTDIWQTVAILEEPGTPKNLHASLAFHPETPVLATLGKNDMVVRLWDFDSSALLAPSQMTPSVYYVNAKVVMVGDTGVGKSGLSLVLTGKQFKPTESTHGRQVLVFDSQEIKEGECMELREILLWDLAGQPGYRLVHQLHLNEVAAALIVFDGRSETAPFAGVRHWDRALRQAQLVQGNCAPSIKKFLIAARTDRGGISVSQARVEELVHDLGFEGYFATSAKEGWNIPELAEALRAAIKWDAFPKVSSTKLFQLIKTFLASEKKAGRLLSTADDLYRAFIQMKEERIKKEEHIKLEEGLAKIGELPPDLVSYLEHEYGEELSSQFKTCIGRVEAQGLIRRLSFGNLILMQPELLDAYASAIVNAAKDEPDGLGSINEENVRTGRFPMSENERIKDKEQEKLLLISTVEDLLRHEIALREQGNDGPYLIFPSQITRENPDLPDPEGKAVIFSFEGAVMNIYATLAVRLSHSGVFKKKEMWENAVTYDAIVGGTCGMFLREIEGGRSELTLFFDPAASEETRYQFEEYIQAHLRRQALPESIYRRRIFVCPDCGVAITDEQAKRRLKLGHQTINCPVCERAISLLDREKRLIAVRDSIVPQMDDSANEQREREVGATRLHGKKKVGDFDVFISYSHKDGDWVRNWLLPRLEKKGIHFCIDSAHFAIGAFILNNIERAVELCPKTLLVLTPNWMESEWAKFESLLSQTSDPAGLRRSTLPLMLEKCELPKRIASLTHADFTQPESQERELERIVDAINDKTSLPEP